jgi:preprotein translocase subunit SecG
VDVGAWSLREREAIIGVSRQRSWAGLVRADEKWPAQLMLYYFIATFYVLTCLILLLVVLLQQGKGGDIASAFGGSSSQTAFGARSGATLLTRVTTVAAALFMVSALALAIIGQRGPGSVVRGVTAPKPASSPTGQPAKPAPAKPAPQQPKP